VGILTPFLFVYLNSKKQNFAKNKGVGTKINTNKDFEDKENINICENLLILIYLN
jgi:hypothetical protein